MRSVSLSVLLIGIVTLSLASLNAADQSSAIRYPDDEPIVNMNDIDLVPLKNFIKSYKIPDELLEKLLEDFIEKYTDNSPASSENPIEPFFGGFNDRANAFSDKFVKEISKNITGNFIGSPISPWIVLSMLAFGARGKTENLMRKVLNHPEENDHAVTGMREFVDRFTTFESVELRLANKIFFASNIYPESEYINLTNKAFGSDVQRVNFSASVSASDIINRWCEEQTNDRIKNIVSPADLNANTALVLVNAVYFKGNWEKKFNIDSTFEGNFYVFNDSTIERVEYMHANDTYRYGELPEIGAKFVELPYESSDFDHGVSMFIILPNERYDLGRLESNFESFTMDELISRSSEAKVDLYLPKFEIESELNLQEPLERLGLGEIFENPDFTGIYKGGHVKVSKIVQKAFIKVDETGSEAAAVTKVEMSFKMMPRKLDVVEFVAEQPFIAVIATTGNNPTKVFVARCADPSKKV